MVFRVNAFFSGLTGACVCLAGEAFAWETWPNSMRWVPHPNSTTMHLSSHSKPVVAARRKRPAFSLVEMVTVVAILGILASIAIPVYSRVAVGAKDEIAAQMVTSLNKAVGIYNMSLSTINIAANANDGADEKSILEALSSKDMAVVCAISTSGAPTAGGGVFSSSAGIPFLRGTSNQCVLTSSSNLSSDYRVRWNGRYFELLRRGVAGTGLRIKF